MFSQLLVLAAEPMQAFCGNAQVEEGEECDPGAFADGHEDFCCDKTTCKLMPGAQCRCVRIAPG